MRLIDADALSEKLCKTTVFIKDGEVFQRMVNDAPTVSAEARPTGEWIPVNDMLPSRSGMFLVTVSEKYGFPSTVWRVMFDIKLSKWFVYGEEFDTDITDDVLAWMPLPTPYKGGDSE